jgi:drug/metabolite transporter (DMT)-like permease
MNNIGKLISIGFLSGLFFSSTFILNRVMSLEGGHWVWSASLRYAYMILFLLIWILVFKGVRELWQIFNYFFKYLKFWMVAGSIGFGAFYALICFSADHAPGWVIATTWQLTIIASLFILICFGRKFPKKTWFFSFLILTGVCAVNMSHVATASVKELLMGGVPVLVATFCYPIGNQMVWEAKNGNPYLPNIENPLLENTFHKILLLSLGSVPFWVLLVAVNAPPLPSKGQMLNTALVALFSGIIATSLFLYARNKSQKASELAAVDATQSSEVVFALMGEIIFLGASFPSVLAVTGIIIVFEGLALFICFQEAGT